MQIVYLSILLSSTVSVLCALDSSSPTPNREEALPIYRDESSSDGLMSDSQEDSDLQERTSITTDTSDSLEVMNVTSADDGDAWGNLPIIVIQNGGGDESRLDVEKTLNEGDRVVRWLVLAKSTHIDKTVETSNDFMTGKTKTVSSENRYEQLQMLRDSQHSFSGNEFDLVKAFK